MIGIGGVPLNVGGVVDAQVGIVTLGFTLNKLSETIQQAIENARNAGQTLEMEAGRQAYLTIEEAKNAYKESLNLTMDRVDQTTHALIVGRVEPEHPVEHASGLLEPTETPAAQAEAVHAAQERSVVDVAPRQHASNSSPSDNSPMRSPTSSLAPSRTLAADRAR